jgi:hypothetical protein
LWKLCVCLDSWWAWQNHNELLWFCQIHRDSKYYLPAVMTIIQLPMFMYQLAKNFVAYIFLLGRRCNFLLMHSSLAVTFQTCCI